jgi:hypothetical protein
MRLINRVLTGMAAKSAETGQAKGAYMNEREMLIGLLRGFTLEKSGEVVWKFIEDTSVGETLGKPLEKELAQFINEHGKNCYES